MDIEQPQENNLNSMLCIFSRSVEAFLKACPSVGGHHDLAAVSRWVELWGYARQDEWSEFASKLALLLDPLNCPESCTSR